MEDINYRVWFVIKAMAAIAHGALFNPAGPDDVGIWGTVLIFQITSFWVVFSPTLNLMRNLSFWYLGKNSGWIDAFFLKYPVLYKVLYGLSVGVMIWSTLTIAEWK